MDMSTGAYGSQTRASDPLELKIVWGVHCGCWELTSGPLQEQQVLLTPEPPFQHRKAAFSDSQFPDKVLSLPIGSQFSNKVVSAIGLFHNRQYEV